MPSATRPTPLEPLAPLPHRARGHALIPAAAIAVVLAGALGAGTAKAEDALCKIALDAGEKTMRTPNHHYLTQTGGIYGSEGRRSESIYTGEASYILYDGTWRRSPIDLKTMLAQEQENRRNTRSEHCAHLRNEAVEGETAGVYSMHYENDVAKVDALVWISRSSGLMLREELDMDTGELGKSHTSMRIVYTGVRTPAGVS